MPDKLPLPVDPFAAVANRFNFEGPQTEEETQNPFDGVDVDFEVTDQLGTETDADVLQGAAEASENNRQQKYEDDFRGQDANQDRFLSKLVTDFEDGPTPQTYPEALREVMKRHGVEYVPNPEITENIVRWADQLTRLNLLRSGLMEQTSDGLQIVAGVTPDLVNRMRGGYLYNLTVTYAQMAPEEAGRVFQRSVNKIGETMLSILRGRFSELETQLAGVLSDEKRVEAEASLNEARQDFAIIRGDLLAQSGDEKIQNWFLGAMYDAATDLHLISPRDSIERARAGAIEGLLDLPFKSLPEVGEFQTDLFHATIPQKVYGKGELSQRLYEVLKRRLRIRDPVTDKTLGYGFEKQLERAFRGSLIEERLDMLGIPPEVAETMGPDRVLLHTHPGVVREQARVKAAQEGKSVLLTTEKRTDIPNFEEKLEEYVKFAAPAVVDRMANDAMSPFTVLQREIDAGNRTGVDALKETIDTALDGVGQAVMAGSEEVGDRLGQAWGFYREIFKDISKNLRDTFPSPDEMRKSFGMFLMASSTAKSVNQAIQDGEDDAQKVFPKDLFSHHANPWFSDIKALTQQMADNTFLFFGDEDRVRLGLTPEARERIFNTHDNPLRAASLWYSDEIAALTAEQLAPLGFSPSTIRSAFGELKNEEISNRLDRSILSGISEEEFEEIAQEVRRRRGVDNLPTRMLNTMVLGSAFLGREVRATTHLLLAEPDDFANITAAGLAGGWMGNSFLRELKTATLGRVSRMFMADRMKTVVTQALRRDPDAVFGMRKFTTLLKAREGTTGFQYHEALLEATTDALDYIANRRWEVLETMPDMKDKRLLKILDGETRRAAKQASEITRHLSPTDVNTLYDDLKLADTLRSWISQGGVYRSIVESVRSKMGFQMGQKRLLLPSAGSPITIFERLEANPNANLTDLPINPEVFTAENTNRLLNIFPSRFRDHVEAVALRDAMEWMVKNQQDVVNVRALGSEAKSNLEGWTLMSRTIEANRLRRIAGMKMVARGRRLQALEDLRRTSLERVSQSRSIRQELLSRSPNDGMRGLTDNPLFEPYTPEQLMAFLNVRYGERQIWERMRGKLESEASFYKRVAKLGERFDETQPDLTRAAKDFKREIIEEFFETPGLDIGRMDLLKGAISDRNLRRNIGERSTVGRAFFSGELNRLKRSLDPEDATLVDDLLKEYDREVAAIAAPGKNQELFADVLLGKSRNLGSGELADVWKELERSAAAARANRLIKVKGISGAAEWGNFYGIMSRVFAGPTAIRQHVQDARNLGLQMRLLTRAYTTKINNIQKFFDKLTGPERDLFSAVQMIARDEGITGPFEMLRKRFPEYFKMVAPRNADEAVEHLWNRTDNFRKNFLKDLADVKLIDKPTFDKLIGPYAPRLFSSSELPRLFGAGGADLWAKPSKILGVSLGGLESQRHIRLFKGQIYARGGRPITRLFNSEAEAKSWIERNYGIRSLDDADADLGGLTGQTAADTQFAILNPLGDEAQKLGADFVGPGAGMFIRMRDLVEDMLQIRYFDALDRPGISLNLQDFNNLPLRERRKFVKLPDTKKFGALSGKWVHRNIMRQIEQFSEARSVMSAIGGTVEAEATTIWGELTQMLGGMTGISALTSLSNYLKQGILYNWIARNPVTHAGNFLSDALFFARSAAGRGLNTTVEGTFKSGREAWRIVRGLRTGEVLIEDLPQNIRRGIELGVIDESIFGAAGGFGRKTADIQALFGKLSPGQVFLSPINDPRIEKALKREVEVDDFLKTETNPRVRGRLESEKLALQKVTLSAPDKFAQAWGKTMNTFREVKDAFVGKRTGRLQDIESVSANFYGAVGNLNRMRAYVYMLSQGLDPETAAERVNRFMQTYSRVALNPIGAGLQRLARTPFGSPVVSFPFELTRITLNMMRANPAFLVGLYSAGLARNMLAIGATGQDPWMALDSMGVDGSIPGFVNILGNQWVPLPNNQHLVVSHPALEMFKQMGHAFGSTRSVVDAWDDLGDNTALSRTMRLAVKFGGNFAFSAPLLNFGLSTVTKRDSFSGAPRRDGYDLLKDNLWRLAQPLVSPYYPIIGQHAEQMRRIVHGFPRAYSQREHSVLNKAARLLGGFRVRGDIAEFLNAFPQEISDPARDAAARFAKASAWLLLWEDPPEGTILGKTGGLSIQDYFALVVQSSSYLDRQGGSEYGAATEKAFEQGRQAFSALESDDPARQRWGADRLKEAEASLAERRSVREDLLRLGVEGRKVTKQEMRSVLQRLLTMGDGYENALSTFSVLRKTGIIIKMATTKGVPEDVVNNLVRQFLFTRNNSLRGPGNVEELQQSVQYLDQGLQSFRASPRNQSLMRFMRGVVQSWMPAAQARRQVQDLRSEEMRRLDELLKRAEKVRQ